MKQLQTEYNDFQTRQSLIAENMDLVKQVVNRSKNLCYNNLLSEEDLIGYGTIGLIEAVDKYKPSKGSLKSFAALRIRGAILDQLRSTDHLKRTSRQRVKQLNEAIAKLEQEHDKAASSSMICQHLNISADELHSIQSDAKLSISSLNNLIEGTEQEAIDTVEDSGATPEENCQSQLLSEELKKKIDSLPQKEKYIVGLYHYKQKTMKEISQILQISESRVCQLHTKAIESLRSEMKDYI